MNIVLIVSDTLRQDHVPCYDPSHVIAPHMNSFANMAQVFDNAYAASFPTVPARADIWTGRFTFNYLDWGPLPKDEVVLPQLMSSQGYSTIGVADTPFLIRNGYGFDRGFNDFVWIRGQRSGPERDDVIGQWRSEEDCFAPRTFKTAIEWLERHHQEQFFLHIDTWDPHEPWEPPAHYVNLYDRDYKGENVDPVYWDWKEDGVSERDIEIAHACYCGEITMIDRWFGMLVDRLQSLDLLSNTAIILTSDHGFYFGEHGIFGKRRFRWPENIPFAEGHQRGLSSGKTYRSPLHPEVARIPLVAYIPGVEHQRISSLASLPDVMPTVLELAGIDVPERVQAQSLLPLIEGKQKAIHDFVVTSAPLETIGGISQTVDDHKREVIEISPSTITNGEWDMLYSVAGEAVELYRTKEDPGHAKNLVQEHPDIAKAMHQSYIAWLKEIGTAPSLLEPRKSL
jgi:arylsulfatase A-like enzyme